MITYPLKIITWQNCGRHAATPPFGAVDTFVEPGGSDANNKALARGAILFPLGLMAATLVAGPATASYEYLHVDGIGVAGGGMVVPETPHLAGTGVAGFGIVGAETSHLAGTGIGGGAAGVAPIEEGETSVA